MEIWKPLSDKFFGEGYYASNTGKIKCNNRILNTHYCGAYLAIGVWNSELKQTKNMYIHRLVAVTFIDNPHKYKYVNHINGIKTDNNTSNLEWVTASINNQKAIDSGLRKTKRVMQYTKNGKYIQTYNSIIEASQKTGANDRHISCVCKGKRKTTGGFVWKYETPEDVLQDVEGKQIDGFPNYKITKDGKVYSKKAKKFLIPKKLPSGYLCVKLCNNGVYKDAYIQKLVRDHYETTNENLGPKSDRETTDGSGENSEVREESKTRDNPVPSS